ncbi:MAG: tRNA (adenosine(37)-N6)-threonylcarbamoyltransferase complex dimerization subunit type 1 TsaB [Gammaproteobacteria bacterium]
MPIILAIDTSNSQCSVALNRDGNIQSAICTQARQHARRLLPMIDEILTDSGLTLEDLDAIAFVNGPGSFTGLRIGAGVAQGLAFGANLPVLALSTLAVMAFKARQQVALEHFLVSMQARENEVYFGAYQFVAGDMCLLAKERVCSPQSCEIPEVMSKNSCCAVGDGWRESINFIASSDFVTQTLDDCVADAISLSELAQIRFAAGEAGDPALGLPVYLKEQMDY